MGSIRVESGQVGQLWRCARGYMIRETERNAGMMCPGRWSKYTKERDGRGGGRGEKELLEVQVMSADSEAGRRQSAMA